MNIACRSIRYAIGVLVAFLACASVSPSQQWTQWRGPSRDGALVGFTAPKVWPKQLTRRWSIEVGEGHSSPLVAGENVFQFSRQNDEEVVRCLDRTSGRQRWRQSYPVAYKMHPAATGHGKGPKSTPLLADGRLYTLGITGMISCWDAASGKNIWSHDYSKKFAKDSPLYGASMSPILVDGMCIAHVGGHGGGALIAFDAASGRERWRWDGDGPGYTSPIVVTIDGQRQLVTQSQEFCIGVDIASGKLLWKIPFTTQYSMNIVAPISLGNLVVFSGYKRGTTAYKIERKSGKWTTAEAWHVDAVSQFMTSPVQLGENFIGMQQRNSGQLFCMSAKTGKVLWTGPPRTGENIVLLLGKDALLALTTNADLFVLKPSAESYEKIAQYKVADSQTWAHPAVAGKQIFIKDKQRLTLWEIE